MTISEKLSQIRERNERGGPRTMQLGGDPNAKVWPAETWRVCDSQADVLPLLETVEAVLGKVSHVPENDNYQDEWERGLNYARREVLEALEKRLGGGDDER